MTFRELCAKEVVQLGEGACLGKVDDLVLDPDTARIQSLLLLGRLLYQSMRIEDPFGSYVVVGVFAMMLFHVVENIGMVIGLLPVTGIPLPFMSYGGSNMLTNMMAIGLAENVIMRARKKESHRRVRNVRVRKL